MAAETQTFPSDADVRALLVDRIDVRRLSVGMAIGLVDETGDRIVTHGELRKGDGRSIDGDTLFEIGSVTKVLTALLLTEMAGRGEVATTDPISKYLPSGVKAPSRGGGQITFIDLATHTSGLPRMDPKYGTLDSSRAYAEYDLEQLYAFLNSYKLTRDVGERFEYSNIGFGLLGHVLGLAAGRSFPDLLRERITEPLGMRSTAIEPTPSMRGRLASPHDIDLTPLPPFDLGVLAGAGALRSTANDLARLLSAELGLLETPLTPAMARQLIPRRATDSRLDETALGWRISRTPSGGEFVRHTGGTTGAASFVGFDAQRRMGVVVLNNRKASPDNLGAHLLLGTPLASARQAIPLAAEALARFVGRYRLGPRGLLSITLSDGQLYAQLVIDGAQRPRPILAIFPASPTHFFARAAARNFSFLTDADGGVTGLSRGRGAPAERIA